MGAFICHTCNSTCERLIAGSGSGKLTCPGCSQSKKITNTRIGSTVDKWSDPNGRTHKLSGGKEWEIINRVISKDDNRTVINKVTGKEAQY